MGNARRGSDGDPQTRPLAARRFTFAELHRGGRAASRALRIRGPSASRRRRPLGEWRPSSCVFPPLRREARMPGPCHPGRHERSPDGGERRTRSWSAPRARRDRLARRRVGPPSPEPIRALPGRTAPGSTEPPLWQGRRQPRRACRAESRPADEVEREEVVAVNVERLPTFPYRFFRAAPEVEDPRGDANDVEIERVELLNFPQRFERRVFSTFPGTETEPEV